MLKKLLELVTDPSTGRMSESKLWIHPAKAVYIWAFVHLTLGGLMTESLLLAFCIPLLAHETISRVVGMKIAGAVTQDNEVRREIDRAGER